MIISIIQTLPWAKIVLVWALITMTAFYATSFDSIAYTASCYSYYRLEENEHPHMGSEGQTTMWSTKRQLNKR